MGLFSEMMDESSRKDALIRDLVAALELFVEHGDDFEDRILEKARAVIERAKQEQRGTQAGRKVDGGKVKRRGSYQSTSFW